MHVFVQHLDGKWVRELHWRDDEPRHDVGWVKDSSYFPRIPLLGWWERLRGRSASPRWRLPFDEMGSDRLGLCEQPAEGSRRIMGTVRSTESELVARDAWSDEPKPWRVSMAQDFLVSPSDGPPIVVSLGLAPILIAPPHRETLGEVIGSLSARHRSLVPPRLRIAHEGELDVVELRAGDVVEVIGVSRPVRQSVRQLGQIGYRDAAPPNDVIGDEDGTRVILRLA